MKTKNSQSSVFLKVDKFTEAIENFVMSVGLYTISIIVFANVISRYFFDISFKWAEELSRYILIWITFFGTSACARYGEHVNADILTNLLKGKAALINKLIIYIICLVTSIYLAYFSTKFTILQFIGGNVSVAIAVPIWLIYLSTCVGFILLSYVYIRKIVRCISEITSGKGAE